MTQPNYEHTAEEALEKVMRETGEQFELVRGNDYTLTLDLDTADALRSYQENLPILQQHVVAVETGRWPSKHGGNHVVVTLVKPMEYQERAGLQAMLGSDPKRELLGYFNVSNHGSEPFALFKPKEGKK